MDVESCGFRINYVAEGAGDPLVLVPGLLMRIDRWVLNGYVSEFTPTHRVIVVDPLGHGASDKPHDPQCYRREGIAADVIAVLDAEGIASAHVWGYSWGAANAYAIATLYPARERTLIAGGAPVASLSDPAHSAEGRPALIDALRREDWPAFFAGMGLNDPATAAVLQQGNDPLAIAAALEAGLLPDQLVNDLAALKGRSLVYAGTAEAWLGPPGAIDRLRAQCDDVGARLELVEGLGHSQTFQAREKVVPFVRDFLATVSQVGSLVS